VLNCPTALAQPEEAACAVIEALATAEPAALRGRNVITAWLGEHSARVARQLFAQARIATYETPDSAVTGFLHRVHYRRNQELLMETPPARPEAFEPEIAAARRVIATALAAGKSWLDPDETGAVLVAYGFPLLAARQAHNLDEAASVGEAIGFPVALKIRSPEITHKSDVGGVALNLGSADRVRQEAMAMLERVGRACPGARLDGFLVQQMASRPVPWNCSSGSLKTPYSGR
jgi:acetyltransferase